jgi:type II secretory pathway pseudopilin PulG
VKREIFSNKERPALHRSAATPALDPRLSTLDASFTLMELLVSVAILGILVVLLFSAFQSSSQVMVRNENRTEVSQSVRAVLDQISRDVERTVYRDSGVNLYHTGAGFLIPNVPTNTLFVLADVPLPERSDGNPVSIGYQIAKTNYGGIDKWVLMRGDDAKVDASLCLTNWWDNCPTCGCPFFPNTNNPPNIDPVNYNPAYWKVLSENVIGIEYKFYTNTVRATADSFTNAWQIITNVLPYSVLATVYTIDTDTYNKALRVDPTLAGASAQNLITNNMRKYSARIFLPRSTQNP